MWQFYNFPFALMVYYSLSKLFASKMPWQQDLKVSLSNNGTAESEHSFNNIHPFFASIKVEVSSAVYSLFSISLSWTCVFNTQGFIQEKRLQEAGYFEGQVDEKTHIKCVLLAHLNFPPSFRRRDKRTGVKPTPFNLVFSRLIQSPSAYVPLHYFACGRAVDEFAL